MTRFDPHSYTRPEQGTTRHVVLALDVDFEARCLRGSATLELAEPGSGPLDLDTRALTIDGVADQDGRSVPWSLDEPDAVLGARLVVDRRPGTRALTIRYRTSPDASALQWLAPEHTSGGELPFLFSQCQPHHARSLAPLQDSPRVRFSYDAALTVPAALTAVMSAAPGERRDGPGDGRATYHFAMPQPIPSYLLALAVGHIAARDLGPRSRVYAEPELLDAAAYEFADVDKMLRSAEALFGPYLWDRFDFIVMPPAFPYGGMENPRLTFLTPTLIAGDRSLVNVLAHELAHSWTGNLVTNATMNDFWLNEGFTVWAERRILEAIEGDETVALAAAIRRHALDQAIERFGADSPLTRLQTDLEGMDPDEVYSMVPYEKGCLFVSLIEDTVGREAFDVFLRGYIEHFRFMSITTAEFEAYLEQQLPGVAAQVDAERWLRGPGIPDNAPVHGSARLDALRALTDGWAAGQRPEVDEARGWPVGEWIVFLQRLPRPLDTADCAWLDEHFQLGQSGNAEILGEWLELAAASAYEPAYPKLRTFLGEVGRMKYLKPIYTALHGGERTRALAAEIFAACADRYHPIARAGLESLLSR